MSVTLATARAEVAKRATEFLSSTSTGGTIGTLIDVNNLNYADAYWAESTILFTSGVSSGLSRRIKTFDRATATATIYGSVSAIPSGVTYEIYRRWTPTEVDTALNRSINIAAPDFREKVRAVATATADTLQYAFPTGPDMWDRGLVGVEYQQYTLATQSTWPFTRLSSDQYEVLEDYDTTGQRNARTLQLRFNPATNRLLRLVFDGPLGNVSTGTDTIHLDLPELEWLYTQSAAELWRMEASKTTDAGRQSAIEQLARWEANADKLRRQMGQEQPQRPLRRTQFRVSGGWR